MPIADKQAPTKPAYWVPDLLPKQLEVFNEFSHRYVLLEGCKMSGKTVAALHKLARHLWETDRAEVAILVRTLKSSRNSGVYEELCSAVMPQWFSGGYFGGCKKNGEPKWIKPGPQTTDNVTKVPYFVVLNRHGTTSRCSLLNTEDDSDAEKKLKGTRFSMIYVPEITNFFTRIPFDAGKVQLRCLHLKYEDHFFLADCNPSEEGTASWIYKLFFEERFLEPQNDDQRQFRNELLTIHFELSDNPRLDPREVADLKGSYESNPDLYNRYVHGLWTQTTINSHFVDVFLPLQHVVGNAENPDSDQWEVIQPDPACHELITSMDPGEVNHSAHIFQKRIVGEEVSFDFLAELVFIKERISLQDFTLELVELMDALEDYVRREYGTRQINWRHWSDSSVFNYNSAADAHSALLIRNYSEGRILVMAPPKAKGSGSVKMRVNLVRKLFFQNRLFISAHLFQTLRMLRGLKKGRSDREFIDPVDPLKHIFDSFSYGLFGEAPLDAQNRTRPNVEKRSSVVAVAL